MELFNTLNAFASTSKCIVFIDNIRYWMSLSGYYGGSIIICIGSVAQAYILPDRIVIDNKNLEFYTTTFVDSLQEQIIIE